MRDDRGTPEVCWRGLRLGLYLAAIVTFSGLWIAQRAEAEISERALSIGRKLDRLGELAAGTTTFEVNGARMSLTTVTCPASVTFLLDRFALLCGRDSGGVSEQLVELGERVPTILKPGSFGVFRSEREDEGVAACFARTDGGGLLETIRRLNAVVDAGDFAALGQLRYVFVRKIDAQQSHMLSVSSLGALELERMFPEHGDAPGGDLTFDVRPAGARRLLSARVADSKLETAMYESELSPERAIAGYDAPMRALGFEPGNLEAVRDDLVASTRVFLRSDEAVLVVAEPRAGRSTISSFRLPSGGFVTLRTP